MFATKHTDEAKAKISKNNARYWLGKKRPDIAGRVSPTKGLKRSKESLDKFKETMAMKPKKKYYCIDCHGEVSTNQALRCRNCQNRYKIGALHHSWRGGSTSENRLQRVKFRKIVQPQVFLRDDYTCQLCNKRGGYLQVDHIKSWRDYPELRFDINNCRTLCMACHYSITFNKELPQGMVWGHNLKQRIAS